MTALDQIAMLIGYAAMVVSSPGITIVALGIIFLIGEWVFGDRFVALWESAGDAVIRLIRGGE